MRRCERWAPIPIRKLVLPRILAGLLMVPLLTVVSGGLGMVGAWIVTVTQLKVPSSVYWNSVVMGLYIQDVWMGLIKPFFIGFTIASIGCHVGLRTRGGTQGVGRATTNAVVAASVAVIAVDFLVTKLLIALDVLMAIQQAARSPLLDEAMAHGGPIIVFDKVSPRVRRQGDSAGCLVHAPDRAYEDFSRRQRRRQVDDPAAASSDC